MDDENPIIEDDIEEPEEELYVWNWQRFTVWYLEQYPDDLRVIQHVDECYRFCVDDHEQNALLSVWQLG